MRFRSNWNLDSAKEETEIEVFGEKPLGASKRTISRHVNTNLNFFRTCFIFLIHPQCSTPAIVTHIVIFLWAKVKVKGV